METQPLQRTVITTTVVKETFAPPPDVSTQNVSQEPKEKRLDPELWGEASIPSLLGLKVNRIKYSKASRYADFGSRKKPCSSKPLFMRLIPMY